MEEPCEASVSFTLKKKAQAPFQSCLQVLFFSLNGKVRVAVLDLVILFANTDRIPGSLLRELGSRFTVEKGNNLNAVATRYLIYGTWEENQDRMMPKKEQKLVSTLSRI